MGFSPSASPLVSTSSSSLKKYMRKRRDDTPSFSKGLLRGATSPRLGAPRSGGPRRTGAPCRLPVSVAYLPPPSPRAQVKGSGTGALHPGTGTLRESRKAAESSPQTADGIGRNPGTCGSPRSGLTQGRFPHNTWPGGGAPVERTKLFRRSHSTATISLPPVFYSHLVFHVLLPEAPSAC